MAKPQKEVLPQGDFTAVMNRLHEIAAASGDALLLGDGPVHPDAALLELASETLHCSKQREELFRAPGPWCEKRGEWEPLEEKIRVNLRRAGKRSATTPAGIYAKILMVRAAKTVAAKLAMTLVDDLLTVPALRASLWPAEQAANLDAAETRARMLAAAPEGVGGTC